MPPKLATRNGTATDTPAEPIVLRGLKRATVEVPLRGITPLIVSKFSEKAKVEMRAKQQGQTRLKKDAKDPHADYMAAQYRFADGRHGIPSVAFKGAIVAAARQFEGITLVSTKIAIFVHGEPSDDGHDLLVPIEGFTTDAMPMMREDAVRLATGVADLRYRPMYTPWSVNLTVTFSENLLNQESLLNLVNAAGMGGVGEWRPSAPKSLTGSYGTFEVQI